MVRDWHGYTKRLEYSTNSVHRASISERNTELILKFKDQVLVEGLSYARIIKYLENPEMYLCCTVH